MIEPKHKDVQEDLKELEWWLKKNAGDQADDWIQVVWAAQKKINALRTQETAPLEDDKTVIGRFVASVGHDFADHRKKKTAQIWPDWSDETKALWGEIESRLTTPKCLEFDADGCIAAISDEIDTQRQMANKADYTTSWRVGICDGLKKAWRLIREHMTSSEGGSDGNK